MMASNVGQPGLGPLVTVVILTAAAVLRADGRTRSSAVDGVPQSGRGCVYSFQVWTPNQDVLAKLRRLEQRCDAVRSNVDHEVGLPLRPRTSYDV